MKLTDGREIAPEGSLRAAPLTLPNGRRVGGAGTGRAPRDVVVHLIGWNRSTREAVEQIRRGEMPPYLMNLPNDFANVNMASVRTSSGIRATSFSMC